MSSQDLMGLLWSYLYVGAVVAVGETARRLGLSREVARKIIHVGVGLWIFGTLSLFTSPYAAAIPPVTAALANWVIHRRQLLKAVEAEPENLGTVWFPISFSILILALWAHPPAVLGGVMAMTVGDATASLVGVRWGGRAYASVGGARKSLMGSLTMLLATGLTLQWLLPGRGHAALLAAVVATCAEALGHKGRDNLWVPLATGVTIYLSTLMPAATVAALALGSALALAIGAAAWWKGSLSPSGVLGAVITGTLLFGFGGWAGGLALVGFFLSSSLLSRAFRARKATAEAEYAKTGTRDLGQALANGGVAAAACLALGLTGDERFLAAALGALAAANADTWATELGVLSRSAPRLITTLRPAVAGSSGAISGAGTLAALAGAAFVAGVGALAEPTWWRIFPWIALGGLAGSMLDSLLGATIQGVFWCPTCAKETERTVHRCGTPTRLHRGWAWLENDLVNLLATLLGAVIGFLAA